MDNNIHLISGIEIATIAAGIKYPDHEDLTLIKIAAESSLAGVFTQNAFCAAPVTICKDHLERSSSNSPFYLLINTGNANAGTGEPGFADAMTCCKKVAEQMKTDLTQVFPFSTGVIGEKLPTQAIYDALPKLATKFDKNHWNKAAKAILTTDTVTKTSSSAIEIQGNKIAITGISKGSGMIRPDMATMLAFIATDLKISDEAIKKLIKKMANVSFNRITVDGDTSTNDSCMLMATGKSTAPAYDDLNDEDKNLFESSLETIFIDLAKAIILDGEGATKLINIHVSHGLTSQECLDVAYTIAHSPLVKTAFFASDPNWGRILAAVGRSGIQNFDLNALTIYLDDVCIVANGGKSSTYTEEQGQSIMNQSEINIHVDLKRSPAEDNISESIWTCDFSYDYVKINAEYRT